MLTIYIDFKSAASYLALRPTLAMIEKTGVEAKWLPFSSRPFSIADEKPNETAGERHRRVRAISQRDTHLHYANAQGLNMQFAHQPAGSDAALEALTALQGIPVPFIQAAFAAYWSDQADLNDQSVVSEILQDCGYGDLEWKGAEDKLQTIREDAEERKVFETPTYIIKGQIFLGREHLPWIRSIIGQ